MSQQALINAYLRYAMPLAERYGIDPYAMAAVAGVESSWNPNSIGDGGTSYGYHQFHQGGAGGNNAKQYLDPRLNVETAARMFAQAGGKGLKGKAAIEAFVRKFERPADPGSEIAKALSYYGMVSGGKPMDAQAPTPTTTAGAPVAQSPFADPHQSTNNLLGYLMGRNSGNQASTNNLFGAFMMDRPQPQQQQVPMAGAPGDSTRGTPQPQQDMTPQMGTFSGLPIGIDKYKLIGTPYSGTHTIGNWQSDNAVDIGVPIGTPIVAVSDGVIGNRIGSLGKGGRFAGLRLTLQGKGNEFYYAHLSKLAVKAGQKVKKGQILGYSGEANGVAHLHFGVENGNPIKLFGLR